LKVTNPLAVKTKIHLPRSPSALLSRTEREKVFLEVHIQNLTPDALWFQRIGFESAEGWNASDIVASADEAVFSDTMTLMQPQDTRQYIYILTPSSLPPFPVVYPPGSVIVLGRLDISWRSSFGEPGRLLTSVCAFFVILSSNLLPLHSRC
jgi:trafficking protein particle complex subunit 13